MGTVIIVITMEITAKITLQTTTTTTTTTIKRQELTKILLKG